MTPEPEAARRRFADRLREAGVDTRRFIDVEDGTKASHDHTQLEPDSPRLAGNYGVYGGPGAGDGGEGVLVDVDVDDYREAAENEGLQAVNGLADTFAVESPHTDDDEPGHRYYRVVPGDDFETATGAAVVATGSKNPDLSWGEVRIENQYVVGPGSQLDGCGKEWCDECAAPDGGYYRIAADRPIATITADDLFAVLDADPEADPAPSDDAPKNVGPAPDVAAEAPDDAPLCYRRTLEARVETPEEAPHAHAVNRVGAILAVYAGYEITEAMEHFEAYPPDGEPVRYDAGKTRTALQGTKEKVEDEDEDLHPPSPHRLRELGILDEDERCNCRLHNSTDRDSHPRVVECEPPVDDRESADIDAIRERIRGSIYDDAIERGDAPTVLAHDPGAGKTTTAHLAAADRDRSLAFLFDKHRKAHEHRADGVTPDVDLHLRGAAQPRDDRCAQAAYAGEQCPDHGLPADCPRMCPVYDLPKDHDDRQLFEALSREFGPVAAHVILEPHDGEECAWFQALQAAPTADTLVGVHEYQRLTSVTDPSDRAGRDVLVDESPGTLADDRHLTIEDLTRLANTLDGWQSQSAAGETLRRFGAFARAVVDAVIEGDDLASLDPPTPVWDSYQSYDEAAGHYLEFATPDEDWQLTEALVQAKRAFLDHHLAQIHDDAVAWDGTPLAIDAVLAAAGEAGVASDAVRRAAVHPARLVTCPVCEGELEHVDGRRLCDRCGWDEADDLYTAGDRDPARILAWVDDGEASGSEAGLVRRRLPAPSDLPDDPVVLDATATPAKVAALYGADQDDVAVYGDEQHALENCHITQILDGQYHYATLADAVSDDRQTAERIQTQIDRVGTFHDRPLVVGRRKVRELFDLPENAEFIHFHGARGLNFEECDAVVVVGASHPDVEDLKRDARLLAQGRDDIRVGGEEYSTRRDCPNDPVYRKLRYEDEDGRGRAVATKHYTGLVGALFRETREREIEQVIHRIRPLLADEMKHAYLLTNVPTDLPVDEVCTLEELAEPAAAMLPVAEGALDLAEALVDVAAGDGPDGFRAGTLVEADGQGGVRFRIREVHRLARASGLTVTERTVRRWVDDLEDLGLVDAGEYESRAGVPYSADAATLTSALSVLTSNAGVEVAIKRRIASLAKELDSAAAWLRAARTELGLAGDRRRRRDRGLAGSAATNGGDPPPDDPV